MSHADIRSFRLRFAAGQQRGLAPEQRAPGADSDSQPSGQRGGDSGNGPSSMAGFFYIYFLVGGWGGWGGGGAESCTFESFLWFVAYVVFFLASLWVRRLTDQVPRTDRKSLATFLVSLRMLLDVSTFNCKRFALPASTSMVLAGFEALCFGLP